MRVENYQLGELAFAYCHRVYLRWDTHRRERYPILATIEAAELQEIVSPDLHILECRASERDIRVLVSLQPTWSVSAAVGSLRGRLTKWLNDTLGECRERRFSRGYFACTTGANDSQSVARYLEGQAEHHGYADRIVPPVYMRSYGDEQPPWHAPQHSQCLLRCHLCLATIFRASLFDERSGASVAERWVAEQRNGRFALQKVSFVPDHVHLAIQLHPATAPAGVVVLLMNAAQDVMVEAYSQKLIHRAVPRVWQPSAYLGSFGDLQSPKLRSYIRGQGHDE